MSEVYYDRSRKWMDHPYRACKGADQEVIFSGPNACWTKPSARRQAIWDDWIDLHCKTCPVLEQCARDTLGEEHGIWGGMTQRERYLARRRQEAAAKKWPPEKRAFWGAEVSFLRRQGCDYSRVMHRTGLTRKLAIELQQEYERQAAKEKAENERRQALAASREAAPVLGGFSRQALPEEPGKRDLWVRHDGRIFDATYKAHSECGQYIKADIRRIQTILWIPVRDCQVYRPVIKRTERKVGRKLYGRVA